MAGIRMLGRGADGPDRGRVTRTTSKHVEIHAAASVTNGLKAARLSRNVRVRRRSVYARTPGRRNNKPTRTVIVRRRPDDGNFDSTVLSPRRKSRTQSPSPAPQSRALAFPDTSSAALRSVIVQRWDSVFHPSAQVPGRGPWTRCRWCAVDLVIILVCWWTGHAGRVRSRTGIETATDQGLVGVYVEASWFRETYREMLLRRVSGQKWNRRRFRTPYIDMVTRARAIRPPCSHLRTHVDEPMLSG